jgi:hypothetical protein
MMRLIGQLLEAQDQEQEHRTSKRPRFENADADLRDEEVMPLYEDSGSEEEDWHIHVKCSDDTTLTIKTWKFATIRDVIAKIQDKGIPVQHLWLDGRSLPLEYTLAYNKVKNGDELVMTDTAGSASASSGSASSGDAPPAAETTMASGSAGPSSSCPSCAALRTELNRLHGLIHELGEEDYFFGTSTFLPP